MAIYQQLYDSERRDSVRTAAYRGMIQSSGKETLPLMSRAITGKDGPSQTAALQLVGVVTVPDATETMVGLLSGVDHPVQAALVEGLSQRGDISATPAIAATVSSPAPEVRLAAINALGILGDASMVPVLSACAASSNGEEQRAARRALVQLQRGNPTETLLRVLPDAKPDIQAEIARALGERGDKLAVPKLMELVRQGSGSARKAALKALAVLVDDAELDAMVKFVAEAKTDTPRAEAVEALSSACHQAQIRRGRVNTEPLLEALATGTTDTRIALLPVCGGQIDPKTRAALRAAVAASDSRVRAAAIRALCDSCDPELLPDALRVACEAPEENLRTLAIRTCVRLTTQEESIKLPAREQIEPLRTILATDLSADQKRVVLAGLAEIPDPQALALAEPMLRESSIQLEAGQTITRIATALPYAQAEAATNALARVLVAISDSGARKATEEALKVIQDGADHIMTWQIAGPYHQNGKEYNELFDIAFPPENPAAQDVEWKAMPPGPDAKRPWIMDLLQALGGNQRVAYARHWVYSNRQQPALLELGTDDGVKVWLNDQVVHTNNTFRGLQPASDKAQVSLTEGWNRVLLKVTQLNQGWAFCARLRTPNGSHMDGLRFSAEPPKTASAGAQP